MAYLSVNTTGDEFIHDTRPTRKTTTWFDRNRLDSSKMWYNHTGHYIPIPKGTIKQLIGREITFEDGPVYFKHIK